jgi:hypothetical protein
MTAATAALTIRFSINLRTVRVCGDSGRVVTVAAVTAITNIFSLHYQKGGSGRVVTAAMPIEE